jgi:alpha-glucosidase
VNPRTFQDPNGRWWSNGVGYEVYVPSFMDGNGDGWGDLPGVEQRLDYLHSLGVDVLWLTPFYPSPMHDHGYDVADYIDVDPRFGTLADFDRLVEKTGQLGMRVLVDLVVNHTSSEHRWFRSARASRDSPHRDYYVWRDPAPDGGPPNNWVSAFGGPAWSYDYKTQQYWLHLYLPEQPDLNWRNPQVVDEVELIMRFWLDRGAAGFRVDSAHYFVKHPDLPDNPIADNASALVTGAVSDWFRFEHRYDIDQPGALDVHRRWRALADRYDALLLGEVYLLDPAALTRYLAQDGLHASFWFGPVESEWPPVTRDLLLAAAAASEHLAWVQSSHDRRRAVTRYGGGDVGRERALAMATLMIGLPGLFFIYQGEELGLEDGAVDATAAADPIATRGKEHGAGRDGARTPMPWAPGASLGFTTAAAAWLPFGGRTAADTAASQEGSPGAPLERYRSLIAAARRLSDSCDAPLEWLDPNGPVVSYRRGDFLVAANLSDEPQATRLPDGRWECAYSSSGGESVREERSWPLDSREAVILRHVSRGTLVTERARGRTE